MTSCNLIRIELSGIIICPILCSFRSIKSTISSMKNYKPSMGALYRQTYRGSINLRPFHAHISLSCSILPNVYDKLIWILPNFVIDFTIMLSYTCRILMFFNLLAQYYCMSGVINPSCMDDNHYHRMHVHLHHCSNLYNHKYVPFEHTLIYHYSKFLSKWVICLITTFALCHVVFV